MNEKEKFISLESEKKSLTLDNLIDQNRFVPEEYKRLIFEQEKYNNYSCYSKYLKEPYSERWNHFLSPHNIADFINITAYEKCIERNSRINNFLKQHLAGEVLIDLGGGTGYMKKFLKNLGVCTYINVDRTLGSNETIANPNPSLPIHEETSEGLHKIDVNADMLDFIARLRNDSANFILNGIDSFVISDKKYHKALAQELIRATKQGGLIFGNDSCINKIWEGQKTSLKRHEFNNIGDNIFFYEKPK
ncbi:MAG: hypothetical protein DDT19_02441 [Syntrophomonadaceae bacterium]|nr:hypothetical protein [Bacillota bacterium]